MDVVEKQNEFGFNDCNGCERSKVTELTHLQTCSFYKEGHCSAEDRGTENLEKNPFKRYLQITDELSKVYDDGIRSALFKELGKCEKKTLTAIEGSEALERIFNWMYCIEVSSKTGSMVSYTQVFAEIYALLVDSKKMENCEVQNLEWGV